MEQFACNYGLNPEFQDRIASGPLRITGVDLEGELRIAELADHPFYVATLFLPQVSSSAARPHPIISAYVEAALDFRHSRRRNQQPV